MIYTQKSVFKKLKRGIIAFAIIFQMSAVAPTHVSSADISVKVIYVSIDGNEYSGNVSSGSPYRTIKKAAEMASPVTTVLVRPGTYIEEDI